MVSLSENIVDLTKNEKTLAQYRKEIAQEVAREVAKAQEEEIKKQEKFRYELRLNYDKQIDAAQTKNEKERLQKEFKTLETFYLNLQNKLLKNVNQTVAESAKKVLTDYRTGRVSGAWKDLSADEKKQTKEAVKIAKEQLKQSRKQEAAEKNRSNVEQKLNDAINNLAAKFDQYIATYSSYQSKINTRLQGSGKQWQSSGGFFGFGGSGGIEDTLSKALGTNAFVKTADVMNNVVKATELGIAYNIEQRAFLQTISENIANTFDAFDSSLLRIIRIQQADSTAARLGLEASLTKFLNSNFQNTEYLSRTFDTVTANLLEATSTMSGSSAVGFEYVVQKWLGSLMSVGFSESAISQISSALGMLGSGNVSGLSNNTAMQNLLVMAASRSGGKSYAELLADGLDASETNKLMAAMVSYLQEIAQGSNQIVQSQYASLFGISMSDLKSIGNLGTNLNYISRSMLDYGGAINELYGQMTYANLSSRLSIGKQMENIFANTEYAIGSNIAANPALYALWKVASMIEGVVGGIAIPTFSVMGNMVDLNTTVTNLMRAGIVGVSTLGAIGDIITGISNTANPSNMLSSLGIRRGAISTLSRGTGTSARISGLETSVNAMVGSSSGEDMAAGTLNKANAEANDQLASKKSSEIAIGDIHRYLLDVFDYKITAITQMLGTLTGYSVNLDGMEGYSYTLDNLSYNANKVVVSAPTGELNQAKQVETITQTVSNIYDLLANGITVSINPLGIGGLGDIIPGI